MVNLVIGTGCVAIAAGRTRLRGAIITLLVMSIINILIAGIIMPVCLRVDIDDAERISGNGDIFKPSGKYDVDTSAVIPMLGVLGFVCFLTTSILSCADLCKCGTQSSRTQAARTQMVMVSPDGKIVPVQVLAAVGTQPVVPIQSDYTPQRRNDQRDRALPSAPPPPYSLSPGPPQPNHAHRAAARESTTSGLYCEVLDSGVYLHAPPLGDEAPYEVITDPGQASGKDDRTDGVKSRQH